MFNNTQNQGGLFGNNQNTNNSGGLFGGNNQPINTNPQSSIFGNTGMQPAKGFGQQQGGGLFGGNQSQGSNMTAAGSNGIFGASNQTQNQQGGLFNPVNTQPQQGGGLFGNQGTTQPQGGMFGATQPAQQNSAFGGSKPAGGLFGPQPAQSSGGLFKSNNQQTQPGGLFGQNQPAQQSGGLFSGGQQQGGIFGNTQQQQPQQGGSLFGNTSPNTGSMFGQNNQPQQTTGNIFGGQPAITNALFGQSQNPVQGQGMFNQQPQQQGAGLFGQSPSQSGLFTNTQQQQQPANGLFGQQQPSTGAGLFGGVSNPPTTGWGVQQAQQPTSVWGQPSTNTTGFGLVNTNQLGGTSWGVNTTLGQPQQGNINQAPMTPVKSKNPKVDNKHTIKCIAALDNYTGMSKQQIRCHYILTGGAPTPQQQPNIAGMFGQQNTTNSLWNKPAINQAPTSFGQIGGSQPATGSLFGGQPTANTPSMFGQKPAGSIFGGATQQPQNSTVFGGQTQGSSLFGNPQQQQPQQPGLFGQSNIGSAFGQQSAQNNPMFGGATTGGLFGNQGGQPAQGSSLFGAQQQAQTGSLFSQQPVQTGSLFGQQPAQTGSLFGQQPAQTGSLFGNTSQPQQGGSLFGGNQPQPQNQSGGLFGGGSQSVTGSLFGNTTPQNQSQNGSLFGALSTPQNNSLLFNDNVQNQQQNSLFGANQSMFSNQGFQSPYANNLNMLSSFPLQASILANEAILDPNYNKSGNNMLAVVLSALVSGGAITKNDADKLLRPTPFDQLVKKRQKQLEKQREQEELFSDIPSVFEDPTNFKRFDVPEDYFEMRRSTGYWVRQKEKQQSDRKKFSVVHAPKKNKQRPLLNTLRENRDDVSRVRQEKERTAQKAELPDYDPEVYTLKPSLMRMKMMSIDEIKRVHEVEIKSKWGKIKFLEPVSLLYKNISESVQIRQDTINITDDQWQNKKCELTFVNFAKFAEKDAGQQKKIYDKMIKWINKNKSQNMQLVSFDNGTGNLIVTIN